MVRAGTAPLLEPLVLTGRTGRRSVHLRNRLLLAPMDGVTDREFRELVLDLGGVGGACTEFVRISSHVVRRRVFERELGPHSDDVPVAVQLMAPGPEYIADSVGQAEQAGATWIDLNFGCPVKRVCGRGAGSALLDEPALLGAIVAATVESTELPVSAKIRLGTTDSSRLDEILDAAAEAGATMITLHARTRAESYAAPAHWDRIAYAADRVRTRFPGVLFVGNGGVDSAEDAHRMQAETGCDAVMIGRAALANPFLFNEACGDAPATPAQAAAFALAYLDRMCESACFGRFKQMLRVYRAGGGIADGQRTALLRTSDPDDVRRYFRALL